MFNLLKKRALFFLSTSNTVSQFGDRLTHMVIIGVIGIFAPGRVGAFSEFSLTFTLPIILLAPFVGVLVDHWNKRNIMIKAHYIQAFLIFITPFFITLTKSLWPVWIMVIFFFSLDLFTNTSKLGIIPSIVGKEELLKANSILVLFARAATFGGMVIGGFLIERLGWKRGFWVNACMHFTAGTLIFGMGEGKKYEPVKRREFLLTTALQKSALQFFDDLKELISLLLKNKLVDFVMFSVVVSPFVSAVAYTVLIYLVQQELNLGTAGVGVMGGIVGIGMLLGALIIGNIKRVNKGWMIIGSIGLYALFFLIGPFFVSVYFLYLISFVAGLFFSFIGIAQDTLLQEEVEEGIRGRIFATKEFFGNASFIFSALLMGYLADFISSRFTLFLAGFILSFAALVAFLLWRMATKKKV